jgi:hypothetical protein
MKINKIRAAGIGCLAAMTGLVTAASMVLVAPADAAHTHADHAAAAPAAPASPTSSGNALADNTSVASGSAQATNGSVASGDAIADNGSVASGCSTALDHSVASGCGPAGAKGFTPATPAKAVAGNPSFAG